MFIISNQTIRSYTMLLFLTCLLSIHSAQLNAQTYSLDEAVHYALYNNKQVIHDQLNSIAAKCRIGETRGALLPRLDIQNQYLYYLNLPEQYAPSSTFGGPEGEYNRMSLTLQQTVSSSAQVTQAIINQEARIRVEVAKVGYEASLTQIDLTKESLTYNVTATYYTIQVLQENLLRLKENILNLEKTVHINEVLKDHDLIAANMHNRLLINLQNLRNEYENQELQLIKNLTQLKYLMNLPVSDSIAVIPFDYDEHMDWSFGPELGRRPDLRLQQIQVRQSEFDLKSVVARYTPVVSGTFASGFTGYYDGFAPHRQINNDWINNTYVALQVKIPVFAGFQKRFQVGQQKLAIQQNVNRLSLYQLRAEREVKDAWSNYNTHKVQLRNTKQSLDLAEQVFISAQVDYANGISTITDLLNAQNDMTDARTNYSSAMLNLKLAELAVKKAHGILYL